MERTIRVTGQCNISVKPDIVHLLLNLSGISEQYDEAVRLSNSETGALQKAFVCAGFSAEDLKTVNFSINTKYENYRDKNNDYKQRFVGYEYIHCMKLTFPAKNEILSKALSCISGSGLSPEINIEYSVEDKVSVKNKLIAGAVKDSGVKAEILAQSAGVRLGRIVRIDYSWDQVNIVSRPIGKVLTSCACNDSFNITPEDIDVSDSVTVIWELE